MTGKALGLRQGLEGASATEASPSVFCFDGLEGLELCDW